MNYNISFFIADRTIQSTDVWVRVQQLTGTIGNADKQSGTVICDALYSRYHSAGKENRYGKSESESLLAV